MAHTVRTVALAVRAARSSRQAIVDSFRKLTPKRQVAQPGDVRGLRRHHFTTLLLVQALAGTGEAPAWFILAVSVWLWFTVLFANFAEAMAEGRGKAQAASLRKRAPRPAGQEA